MSYLKFKADYIFTGYDTIPGNNKVLITHENGEIESIVSTENAGDDIQIFSGILSPGFINCHCHLELSHLKNTIPPKTGLISFILNILKLRDNSFEIIQDAMLKAEEELYNSGTVAVGDISNDTTSIDVKKNSKLHYYNFIEAIGFVDSNAESRFNLYENVFHLFETELKNHNCSIVPHAAYSVSEKLFHCINQIATNKTICIHNQETLEETKWFKNKEGTFYKLFDVLQINSASFSATNKSSLQSYLPYLTSPKNIILVHNSFTTQADVEFAKQHAKQNEQNIFWCICNNANQYIEQVNPPIELLYENNCNIVIGTDSYSSNWSLNMLDEIKTIINSTNNKIKTNQILQWATINGAQALQMDSYLGTISKGKMPGVVIIENTLDNEISYNSTSRRLI